jgi:hypothetical protein
VLEWFSGILEVPECLVSKPVAGTVIWEPLSIGKVPGHSGKWGKMETTIVEGFDGFGVVQWYIGSAGVFGVKTGGRNRDLGAAFGWQSSWTLWEMVQDEQMVGTTIVEGFNGFGVVLWYTGSAGVFGVITGGGKPDLGAAFGWQSSWTLKEMLQDK